MKAMLVDENKNLVWTEVETPKIKADEVLVRVCAAALNRADLLQRQGKYPSPPGCPEWMGLEIAGIVADTGEDVASWKVGDRVCALLGGGGYAEYAAVRRDMLMPVPKGLMLTEAASLPEAIATEQSASFMARMSLTPSPVIATVWPAFCIACTSFCFCAGVTRPKTV